MKPKPKKSTKKSAPAPVKAPRLLPSLWLEITASGNWRAILFITFSAFLFFFPLLIVPSISYNLTTYVGTYLLHWLGISILILALISIPALLRKEIQLPFSSLFYPLGVWITIRIISSLHSFYPNAALLGAYGDYADGIYFNLSLLFLGLVTLALQPKQKERLLWLGLFLLQGTILGLQTIAEVIQEDLPHHALRANYTPFNNPDYLLSYALLIIPLAALAVWKTWRGRAHFALRIISSVSLLSLIVAMFLCLPSNIQSKFIHLPSSDSTTTSGSTTSDDTSKPFLSSNSNVERFTEWKVGLDIGKQYPLLGAGPGAVQEGFFQQLPGLPNTTWNYTHYMIHPHNDLIEQFAETGILGLLSYIAVWVIFFGLVFRQLRRKAWQDKEIIAALLAGLALFLIFNLFLFTTLKTGVVVAIFISLILQLTGNDQGSKKWQSISVKIFFIGFTLFFLYMTPNIWNHYQAELVRANAATALNQKQYLSAENLGQKTISLYPNEASYQGAASIYFLDAALVYPGQQGYASQALASAKKTVQLDPYNPQYGLNLGVVELVLSQTPETTQAAATTLQEALAKDPWDIAAYARVADAYRLKGNASLYNQEWNKIEQQAPKSMLDDVKKAKIRYSIVQSK